MKNQLLLLALSAFSVLSAACPDCEKAAGNSEVRVRGVLQKKPSSVKQINKNTNEQSQEEAKVSE